MAKPPAVKRNLVVFCDGTANEIGVALSNVMKLYRMTIKDDNQLVYYDPGIGTVRMPDSWGKWRQAAGSLFEMATGKGLDQDVLDAYCFLCSNYREGDDIYLFGFSRGAYTVRVVAGLVYLIGLLRPHQVNFAGYALKAYKQAKQTNDFELARQFNRTVNGQCVSINFLGVWDTVSSVIVPGRAPFTSLRLEELPHTSHNPAVEIFRHAIAIDEFRRMFRIKRWEEPQTYKPNVHATGDGFPGQDIKQVWFAGCHSDVGGGFVEEDSALSKFPLIWMLEAAKLRGLRLRTAMVNHIARGVPVVGQHDYVKPSALGTLHKSLTLPWWAIEWFPKSSRLKDWPRRRTLAGLYLPFGEPRHIPDGSLIHKSVIDRMRARPKYKPVNLPAKDKYQVES